MSSEFEYSIIFILWRDEYKEVIIKNKLYLYSAQTAVHLENI